MLEKTVKLAYVNDMVPMAVHVMVGEVGTVIDKIKAPDGKDVWLIVFENGKKLWSRRKYLEVIND